MQKTIRYVSFDIYDTLVHRLFSTAQIYQMMERILNEEKITEHFAERRISAEQLLRDSGKVIYTLEDIYETKYFEKIPESGIKRIIYLEKQMELENAIFDKGAKKLYQKYEAHYHVVCTSDMYFNKEFLQELLCRNGYQPERIYVSSDAHCSKRNRKLYQYVADDLKVATQEILHFGDSLRSDWLNAKLSGCQAQWLPYRSKKIQGDDYAYYIGVQLFGPMMYEFCRWIHEYDDGKSPLLFLAREGEFIKQCYDMMYPGNSSFVVYLSRQAILLCMASMMLRKCTIEEFRQGIYVRNNESISDVLRRIGLDVRNYEDVLRAYGLTPEDKYDERIERFFQSDKEEILLELEEKNCQIAVDYLNQCLAQGKILVDIGWRGSMQKLLQQFLCMQDSDVSLMGLYLGIDDDEHKAGFLYQDKGQDRQNIRCFSGLLEIVMMPDHGTTLGYRKDPSKGIVPIFAPNEFSKESYQTIAEVQQGIQDLIRRCTAMHLSQHYKREDIIRKLVHFGCYPERKAMKIFGSMEFFENEKIYRLIENTSFLQPKKMYRSFLQTRWKTGFLKSAFKLKLPYHWIINFLREKIQR